MLDAGEKTWYLPAMYTSVDQTNGWSCHAIADHVSEQWAILNCNCSFRLCLVPSRLTSWCSPSSTLLLDWVSPLLMTLRVLKETGGLCCFVRLKISLERKILVHCLQFLIRGISAYLLSYSLFSIGSCLLLQSLLLS